MREEEFNNKCTGCQACKEICPKKGITMVEDKEGFLYPQKNNNCVECELCKKVCPLNNEIPKLNIIQEVYAGIYKDNQILNKSSSGGAFTAICNSFCDDNYVIFGAKFDKDFNVVHGYIKDIKEIDIFRKSKYVQSDVKNSYTRAEQFLKSGKKVLFSGTPCQIAGLRSFLRNKAYENLLCVDVVCHGVPSAKVWGKYIKFVQEKYNSKIKSINFREKTYNNNKWNSKNIQIILENNKKILENNIKNDYLRGYHNRLFYRLSCKECKFANPNRISDITIGDCWGIDKVNNKLDVHRGVSLIVVNSKKGKDILNNLSNYMYLNKLDLNFAIQENETFRQPTKFHKNRDKFYKNIEKFNFSKLIKKYTKENYKIIIKRKLAKIIPTKIKNYIKKNNN